MTTDDPTPTDPRQGEAEGKEAGAREALQREAFGEAARGYAEAAALHEALDDPFSAALDHYQAAVAMEMGALRADKTIKRYKRAVEGFEALRRVDWLARACPRLVRYLIRAGRQAEALIRARRFEEAVGSSGAREVIFSALALQVSALKEAQELDPVALEAVVTRAVDVHGFEPRGREVLSLRLDQGEHDLATLDDLLAGARVLGDAKLVGRLCQERGGALVAQGRVEEALPSLEEAREVAIAEVDAQLYILSGAGLVSAYDALDRRYEAMEAVFRMAASLEKLIGKGAQDQIFPLLDALKLKWGEAEFERLLALYREDKGV
jgi:tetratricopeptide (TPR) repeat protein